MNDRPIIWATDFSTSSEEALVWAEALARDRRTKLVMLHVEPGQPTSEFGSIYKGLADPNISDLARALASIKPRRPGVEFEHRIRAGDPAAQIVAEAKECGAAAIVVGSHGRAGIRKLIMGSVAEAVLRDAPCPVLVCKHGPAA